MNTPGRIKHRTPASLKDAFAQLVEANGGDVAAGNKAQRSKSQINRYYDEAEPDLMPIPVVIALEVASGEPIVTRYMAMQTNHTLLCTQPHEGHLATCMAEIGKDTGELLKEFALAIASGDIHPKDAARVAAACHKDMSALAALYQLLLPLIQARGAE